jgi:LacI family transcriptional regulator, galactose operon repressor
MYIIRRRPCPALFDGAYSGLLEKRSDLADNVVEQPVTDRRAPTMRDVAALAGVSFKTVSRVVNREAGVSSALEERVREAVELLGYRPNVTASSLRRRDQKTRTIALLLEDVSNPFSSALHRAIEDVAVPRGTLVFAGSADEQKERERSLLLAFLSRRVDGLIVVPVGPDQTLMLRERRFGRPIVFVDRPGGLTDADTVTSDNREGARRAVRHLAAGGHRRIAFLGDASSVWTATERHLGYVEGLSIEGIRLDDRLVAFDVRSSDAAEGIVHDLLTGGDPPSAVFTGQNLITIGAVRSLQKLGLQHQIALVGFDDVTLGDLLQPPVSVIAQDPTGLGRVAAELLFARLAGDRSPPRHVVVPTRLVARGSGEIPAPVH